MSPISMRDDDPIHRVEVIDAAGVEATPIGLLTFTEIMTHLFDRFDGMVVAAANHGEMARLLDWGDVQLCQRLLHELQASQLDGSDRA
jgi:hypothetical protein